jgi:hypothetical protein
MRHPASNCLQANPGLNGEPKKFNLANTLTCSGRTFVRFTRHPESVDAAKPALYKTANGGGRNPAADVL